MMNLTGIADLTWNIVARRRESCPSTSRLALHGSSISWPAPPETQGSSKVCFPPIADIRSPMRNRTVSALMDWTSPAGRAIHLTGRDNRTFLCGSICGRSSTHIPCPQSLREIGRKTAQFCGMLAPTTVRGDRGFLLTLTDFVPQSLRAIPGVRFEVTL